MITEHRSRTLGPALVTGAAGGIGRAVVAAIARTGRPVAAMDRNRAALEESVATLRSAGHDVTAFAADVSRSIEVEAVVEAIERTLGPLAQLVNGAGIMHTGNVADFADEPWQELFAVNTGGVFHTSRAVVNRMIPRRSGAIVTIASNAGNTPRAGMAAYAATKAAAAMLTKSLGLEVARYGIRCNVVAPGSTVTPMLEAMWQGGGLEVQQAIAGDPASYKVAIPLNKLAQPDDIADAVLFLLSDRAGHITLHDLTVDGGASLGA